VIGRFAPSPTGPLHVGNLRTAMIAWLAAHATGGKMLLRVEDLDRANSSAANEELQLRDLARLGITHPAVTVRQSERFDVYRRAIDDLRDRGLVYPCYCSRKEIREAASAPNGPLLDGAYPGTCRELDASDRRRREEAGRTPAWRLRTDGETYLVADLVAGPTMTFVDDVVLQRNDGVPAYNLAVVVDDMDSGITEIVRGADLLEPTVRQIALYQTLGAPVPDWVHLPLAVLADGNKLSKQNHAPALALDEVRPALWQALHFLGQCPPPELMVSRIDEIIEWGIANWQLERVPASEKIPLDLE